MNLPETKEVLSVYYARFDQFMKAVDDFFAKLDCYRSELDTLMTDRFEILNCA